MNKFIAGRRYIASSPSSLMAPPLILIRLARTSRTSSNEIAAVILIRHSGALFRYTARSQSDMHCLPPAKKKRREEKIYRTDSIKQERKRTFFSPRPPNEGEKEETGKWLGPLGQHRLNCFCCADLFLFGRDDVLISFLDTHVNGVVVTAIPDAAVDSRKRRRRSSAGDESAPAVECNSPFILLDDVDDSQKTRPTLLLLLHHKYNRINCDSMATLHTRRVQRGMFPLTNQKISYSFISPLLSLSEQMNTTWVQSATAAE